MALVRALKFDSNYGVDTEIALADTLVLGKVALTGISGIGVDMGNQSIVNLLDPVNAQDAATKGYADKLAVGIDSIDSCRALSNVNIATLSGTTTIDSVALVAGDRVLLINQSDPTTNGVWLVQTGTWTRPRDFATGLAASGKHTFIEAGDNVFGGNGYLCNTQKGSDTVGTNALTWIQFGGLGEVTAGNGLAKSTVNGNTISIALAPTSGLQFTSGALDHFLNTAGGLNKTASGLGVVVNANNTLAVDANGLRTLGLPGNFTVAGNPVDNNVTAQGLNTLSDGPSSIADSLHQHQNVLSAQTVVHTHTNGSTALNLGDAVQWGTNGTLVRCDAANLSTSLVIGIALAAAPANAMVPVLKRGIAPGVLSGATGGSPIYLAVGGGLTATLATGISQTIVRVGYAASATSLEVNPVTIGQRAAT